VINPFLAPTNESVVTESRPTAILAIVAALILGAGLFAHPFDTQSNLKYPIAMLIPCFFAVGLMRQWRWVWFFLVSYFQVGVLLNGFSLLGFFMGENDADLAGIIPWFELSLSFVLVLVGLVLLLRDGVMKHINVNTELKKFYFVVIPFVTVYASMFFGALISVVAILSAPAS